MEIINFIILPLSGMIVGFITNFLAVRFLFWPEKKILFMQGVIPKRKEIIAEKIAESSLHILPNNVEKLQKIPYLGIKVENYIKKEIREKIKNMDNKKLQKIVENTSKKELRFIEISGAVFGFVIGIIQALILELI